jgi:hypothetical protein
MFGDFPESPTPCRVRALGVLRHQMFERWDDVIVVRETSLVCGVRFRNALLANARTIYSLWSVVPHALPLTTSISLLNRVQMRNAPRVLSDGVAIPGEVPSETDTRPLCRRLEDGYSLPAATYPIAQPK